MAAPYFSTYSYTNSNYQSNDGSIINIQVAGSTAPYNITITGPNGYIQNYVSPPAIPDQLNLEPGTYSMSVSDSVGEVAPSVEIIIEEKPETILTSNITDACNCPNCDCIVTVSDYIHNSNCFTYNLYDGNNPVPVATYTGCRGDEYHQFTGLCTGDYRIEAIELDEILYTVSAGSGNCPPGDLTYDKDSDPNTIVNNWDRFAFLANTTLINPSAVALETGLDKTTGTISNAVGTYFERGVSWDLGDFNLPMTEGDNIGPVAADALSYRKYYYNTAINKYVICFEVGGGLPTTYWWCVYDPKVDTGTLTGNPTATQYLTTSTQWNVVALTATQVTVDSFGNVVSAQVKNAAFPEMIQGTFNSSIINGFYSGCLFNDYVHEVTIGSTNSDDDEIAIVMAAYKDVNGIWGAVDVTHTIQLLMSTSGSGNIRVALNFGSNTYGLDPVVVPGNLIARDAAFPTGAWSSVGNIRIKIEKIGSIFNVYRTDPFTVANIGNSRPYSLVYTFDLVDPNTWHSAFKTEAIASGQTDILEKFLTNIKIGYGTASQPSAQFYDIAFEGFVSTEITESEIEDQNAINEIIFEEPCDLCYLATNCENHAEQVLITISAEFPPLDTSVTYVFNEFPDKCWTVETSDLCYGTAVDPIVLNTGFIDAVNTLGVEDQPDFNWNVVQGDVPVPTPAIITDQSIPGYGSLFNALWINQLIAPHLIGISQPTIYEKTFVLPPSFTPQLVLDLLSEIRAVVTLNGFIIGDNNNPVTYPDPLGTPANFSTSNPIHFNANPAVNTLRVEINVHGEERNGFALAGNITSQGQLLESTPVTIQEIFPCCEECTQVCYELTDCEGTKEPIQTNTDLAQYVGQTITILTCPETCWTVAEIECPTSTEATYLEKVYVKEAFADCVSCLPAPVPVEPFEIKSRTVKPGYNTKGCSIEYVEKISCDYSEALYQEVITKRYGIKFCCSLDLDALDIKKQLMDFKMITDPDVCKPAANCCPPCNVTAELLTFTPLSCLAPIDVQPFFLM